MHDVFVSLGAGSPWLSVDVPLWVANAISFLKVVIGFSFIIFVHELGHFMAAKWVGVRVDRFAVGFGYRLCGWRRGEGFTFGNRPNYTPEELGQRKYGETDYCFKALPFGGYVKMLGQEDIIIDEKTGAVTMTADPRAFTNRTVGQRMIVVSAGVLMNLLFGALAFMAVFLMGIEMAPPVIGGVDPDGPAAKAGLRVGDRIVAIDGERPLSFMEAVITPIISDGPLTVEVERDGKRLSEKFTVTPELDPARGLRSISILPMFNTVLTADGDPVADQPNLKEGDRIISVDGSPVSTAFDFKFAIDRARHGQVKVVAQRPKADRPGEFETVETFQHAGLDIEPAETIPGNQEKTVEHEHILGFLPRRRITMVQKGMPADEAGFKVGDAVVDWDGYAHPTWPEAMSAIRASDGKVMRVVVERDRQLKTLTVKQKGGLSTSGRGKVGLLFHTPEENRPVVADVRPDTPAAALNMPRGSLILSVNGVETKTWWEVIDALRAAAGGEVEIRYRSDKDELIGRMRVPSSLVDALKLPPDAIVLAIDGEKEVRVKTTRSDGRQVDETLSVVSSRGIRRLLETKIGQTVRVRYAVGLSSPIEADFAVTPDNVDPWPMRIRNSFDISGRFAMLKESVHANGNPVTAMWMGLKVTGDKLMEIYHSIRLLASRRVSVDNVQGPVGIISTAVTIAKEGVADLIFFLAFLSVNLAVINCAPMPVVDGGLMLFLLIEKIKGKPLSIKTQMISTIVGLAVIVLCFLFVTIQDVTRLFG